MAYGPPAWSKLGGGIVALVLLIGGAFSIIAFARIGSLKGDTYVAYILADQANGILKGTDVWLQGQKVGVVKSVGFRSLPSDTSVRTCLLYTSDAADEEDSVDLGGRRIIKK